MKQVLTTRLGGLATLPRLFLASTWGQCRKSASCSLLSEHRQAICIHILHLTDIKQTPRGTKGLAQKDAVMRVRAKIRILM